MQIVEQVEDWRRLRKGAGFNGRSVGLVPTMGNLHAGHLSLLERCARENDLTVMTVFVNPAQFDDPRDLASYPRTFREDLERAERSGVDFLFAPSPESMYPDAYRFRVTEADFSQRLCGKHRPGHFEGVLTIVLKLLNLVKPDRTYFGEKDFQQFLLIRDMVRSVFLETEVIPCPTIRDSDGLALSSRNSMLNSDQRKMAPQFPMILAERRSSQEIRTRLERAGFQVDYVEDYAGRRYAAVRIGGVRLIDNLPIESVL